MATPKTQDLIPVTILTGFLGAGTTPLLNRRLHERNQCLRTKRFQNVFKRSRLHGLDGGSGSTLTCHQDNGHSRICFMEPVKQFKARQIRKSDV